MTSGGLGSLQPIAIVASIVAGSIIPDPNATDKVAMTPVAESMIVVVIPIHSRSPVTEITVASRGAVVKVARRVASTDIGTAVAA